MASKGIVLTRGAVVVPLLQLKSSKGDGEIVVTTYHGQKWTDKAISRRMGT